jgi:hypothetical protein
VLSSRKRKARQLAARQSARAARIRKHANHLITTDLARRFKTIVLEDLRIANMTASAKGTLVEPGTKVRQKAGLNRSILETGWGQFELMLAYKTIERSGEIRLVDPRNTSRLCPQCGHSDARNRESQALFRCAGCGQCPSGRNAAFAQLERASVARISSDGSRRLMKKSSPFTAGKTLNDHLDAAATLSRLAAAWPCPVLTPLGNDTILRAIDPRIAVRAHDWGDGPKSVRCAYISSPRSTGRRAACATGAWRCGAPS